MPINATSTVIVLFLSLGFLLASMRKL